jgi:hypothetical protein
MTTVSAVQIRFDAKNKLIDRDLVVLSKHNKDEVEWISEDNQSYTVRFGKHTPFHAHEFRVPANDCVSSGPPLAKAVECHKCSYESPVAGHAEHYKYEIWVAGKMILDPEVVIKP